METYRPFVKCRMCSETCPRSSVIKTFQTNMFDCAVTTAPADGLAPLCAMISAGNLMTR